MPIMFVFRCSLQAASVGHVVVYICVGRAEAAEILTRPSHVSLGGNYREMAPLSDERPFIWERMPGLCPDKCSGRCRSIMRAQSNEL